MYMLLLIIITMPKNILSNNNHSQFSTAMGSLACSNLLPELKSLNSQKNTLVACKTSKRIKSRNWVTEQQQTQNSTEIKKITWAHAQVNWQTSQLLATIPIYSHNFLPYIRYFFWQSKCKGKSALEQTVCLFIFSLILCLLFLFFAGLTTRHLHGGFRAGPPTPFLPSQASLWPLHGVVLTGGMHNDRMTDSMVK